MTRWIAACRLDQIEPEDMVRFDHDGRTFVIIRAPEGTVHCTDGLCTHEKVHLADGMVTDHEIECPKHSATFDYRTGEALRAPACVNLRTYPTRIAGDMVEIEIG
ncbi:MocE family 2Fe-2S type ferredoxin [Thetidibacter halocola]|uniref:Rieske 2Fe-2S domain-containing protein n=1 Tax=Thetidibacter halocola TaxID=2827239 RepID=A0A8J7WJZ0_9RHOB|nr:MocE family 2Fe-2S type ferredoxin [Thetidibacter halocola]MBS0126448.1 Rieske 2Fe-2S domain-containing protein [Thetidibacter halocola]